ncbi:type II toxin-antitoxin system HipA family toxin [Micromonospora sp. NPDC049359]|uniref:type II toxin-antitoxin system HipA family toxin n=1 Tax=Micromonospora sp. NPDC049359 TaxID=3364270 RepID=UPI0037B30BAC
MTARTAKARVLLGDRHAGVLHYAEGLTFFAYEDLEPDHPVLGLPFEYNPDVASRPVAGVPSWFANLLPERESALRKIYNQQLRRRDVPDFLLLLHLGHDLPGAIRVEVEDSLPGDMAEALEIAQTAAEDSAIGFSLSGMQLKFSMKSEGEEFHLPEPHELGDWIVKLPSNVHAELPANEHIAMAWASAIGIDIPENSLVPLSCLKRLPQEYLDSGGSAFAVRRFDRTEAGRVHQEDFAQIFDVMPASKDRGAQELIGQVILDNCPQDFDEYIRRLVFCVAVGNNDEHLKNWSLRYPDGRTPRLSPAYDLVAVTSYPPYQRKGLTLPIAGQADMRYLTREHFRRFAESLEGSGAEPSRVVDVVDTTVRQLRETWPQIRDMASGPYFVVEHLDQRITSLPLLRAS